MKTKEELNAPKKELETESKKPLELTDEEIERVNGGTTVVFPLNGLTVTCNCLGCGKEISGTIPFVCKYCGYRIKGK